ncbi:MAG: metallopeptidase TldD-related protein [bacterium]
MKKTVAAIQVLLGLALFCGHAQAFPADDIVFKAMKDEMTRTTDKLRMDRLQKPYFGAYAVMDATRTYISGSFGGELDFSSYSYRQARVEVRIGAHSFDNMDFAGRDFWVYGPQVMRADVEDNYDALRFVLWQATDQAYKQSLERFSQKKAYRETKNITEQLDDLSKEKPFEFFRGCASEQGDLVAWRSRIRELSSIFKKYPELQNSSVSLDYEARTERFLNSEGSAYRVCIPRIIFNFNAETQARDGLRLADSRTLYFSSWKEVRDAEKLADEARRIAADMTEAVMSSTMDAYVGPVVFEGQAAAEFFNQLLARNISFPRAIWVEEEGNRDAFDSGAFSNKLGMRVASALLSAEDNPLVESHGGVSLIGSYQVDIEGVPARKVELVKKGKLLDFYMGRTPVKERKFSNGHGRGGFGEYATGRPGNLFITAEKSMPQAALRQKMLDMCRELELDYGIVIKRMTPESSRDDKSLLSPPLLAYRVHVKDGREEPVHGVNFTGVSFRALRDVLAASDEQHVYNYMQMGPFHANRGYAAASIVAPSVLVQEMELKKTETKPEKLPYLRHPYFEEKY